jgi:hypothetical protein
VLLDWRVFTGSIDRVNPWSSYQSHNFPFFIRSLSSQTRISNHEAGKIAPRITESFNPRVSSTCAEKLMPGDFWSTNWHSSPVIRDAGRSVSEVLTIAYAGNRSKAVPISICT